MTIEELQQQVLDLTDALNEATAAGETAAARIAELVDESTRLRDINHQLFLRATAATAEPEPEEENPPTCEEFARDLATKF